MNKKILFLTGTRADYGKMKPLMRSVEESENFDSHIFITGMHTMKKYGDTQFEVISDGYKHIQVYMNQIDQEPMDLVLANTINGLSRYVKELGPDMMVIHGDRIETLAGAIVGALNNILVAHVEGGELSGTIDESIRHSVTKLAHIHFVSNEDAKKRLVQLGENKTSIHVIGSPDIDSLIATPSLSFSQIKARYYIEFQEYAMAIFHPLTTEVEELELQAQHFVNALLASGHNYILIYPNNDLGSNIILKAYERFSNNPRFKIFPSIRFEYFLEFIKNCRYMIGNSSCGIHETPFYGIPSINIGNRQKNRFEYPSIINSESDETSILAAIEKATTNGPVVGTTYFGTGNSAANFVNVLNEDKTWKVEKQKIFADLIET